MIGDAPQHIGELDQRLDVVELGGLGQREHRGGAFPPRSEPPIITRGDRRQSPAHSAISSRKSRTGLLWRQQRDAITGGAIDFTSQLAQDPLRAQPAGEDPRLQGSHEISGDAAPRDEPSFR